MIDNDKIEYLGYNISPEGRKLEEKVYYFWNHVLAHRLPPQLVGLISPFDYATRENDGFSISAFAEPKNLDKIFDFISLWMKPYDADRIKHAFSSIYNRDEGIHYPPILSLKYRADKLEKISLYVGPLQNKSAMQQYLDRTLETLKMTYTARIWEFITAVVISRICDMYMAAWDMDKAGCFANKVYLKIKDFTGLSAVVNKEFAVLTPYLQIDGFRLSVIGFVFAEHHLSHYNLYYKPLQ